jgi:UDP-glucose 4-epimerase
MNILVTGAAGYIGGRMVEILTAYILPPIHNKKQMEDINKGGTRNVIDACAKAGVKQILYTSSTTAYGFYPDNDSPLIEDSPLRGNDDFTYAKNMKEIERTLQGFIAQHPDMTVTIVRPCFVVGPGFKNPMAEHLKKKFVMLPSKTLPWWLLYPLNNLSWFLRLSFITKFPSPAMRMMVNPWVASSEKLVRQTGYQFKFNSCQAFESFALSASK